MKLADFHIYDNIMIEVKQSSKSKYVVEYRLGGFNEGGAGATVVTLRKK